MDGSTADVNPQPFVWRPQKGAAYYELEYAQARNFQRSVSVTDIKENLYCSSETMKAGTWFWRVRAVSAERRRSEWSEVRSFTMPEGVHELPMVPFERLLSRIPKTHPRLFMRPEKLPLYRKVLPSLAAEPYAKLKKQCEAFLKAYEPPKEPELYPPDLKRHTREWKSLWWGNRMYVIKYLGGAANLAFKWRLDGDKQAAATAREILLATVKWDPRGATGYRYNDEAGMPFCTRFSRAYTYLYDYLSESERQQCRELMRIRGEEMYNHLCPRLYWTPFESHANRAWHFLGEAGVAFYGELPEAEKWLRFVFNYFWCIYPVWGDADGGWHEGASYWNGYMGRFFRWGDIMRSAFGVNAALKPYFANAGDFALYQEVPGFRGGGFGDCAEHTKPGMFTSVMISLASYAKNPYWQWYADWQASQARSTGEDAYVDFTRLGRKRAAPKEPKDLPTSKVFRGNGVAVMNTCLTDAANDLQVLFKSAPSFGTGSHGYDANNSFLVNAWGDRLFIHGGYRDNYGSPFHKDYMWTTRSCNAVGPTGDTQKRHDYGSRGEITDFETTPTLDRVTGVVGPNWEKGGCDRHERTIYFRKKPPERILVVDRLKGPKPTTWSWYLHTPDEPFFVKDQHRIAAQTKTARCLVDFLWPEHLKVSTTSKFDPPIGCGRTLEQHHLEACTTSPSDEQLFVTLLSPSRREGGPVPAPAKLICVKRKLVAVIPYPGGTWRVEVGPEPKSRK